MVDIKIIPKCNYFRIVINIGINIYIVRFFKNLVIGEIAIELILLDMPFLCKIISYPCNFYACGYVKFFRFMLNWSLWEKWLKEVLKFTMNSYKW